MKKININLGRVFLITAICSLTLIHVVQWTRMIASPILRTGTDFMAFYAAGRIAQMDGYSKIYDFRLQHDVEQSIVGFDLEPNKVLRYVHMPYLVPIIKLLTNTDYVGSFIRWTILMLFIYIVASVFLIWNIFPTQKNTTRFALFVGAILFYPFFTSLLNGQDTALLFLGTTLWGVGLIKRQPWLIAAGLALITIRPHICLILAIPTAIKYPKIVWRFFILAGLLALISIFLIGQEGLLDYFQILQISASGNWFGINEDKMVNLIGLFLRILPGLNPALGRTLGWIGYGACIVIISILWLKTHSLDQWLIGISIIAALFFSPHLHYHDLSLLFIPLLFSTTISLPRIPIEYSAHMILGISLLLTILQPLHYVCPYVLYLALAWWLIQNRERSNLVMLTK